MLRIKIYLLNCIHTYLLSINGKIDKTLKRIIIKRRVKQIKPFFEQPLKKRFYFKKK